MLKFMYDNIQVAHREGTIGNFHMVLEDNLHERYIPMDLWVKGKRSEPLIEIIKWMEERIFPEERVDADKLLKQLGLKEYDPFKIAKITRASMFEDGWWVAFEETDTFRDNTIRGKSGFHEWVSPTEYALKTKY